MCGPLLLLLVGFEFDCWCMLPDMVVCCCSLSVCCVVACWCGSLFFVVLRCCCSLSVVVVRRCRLQCAVIRVRLLLVCGVCVFFFVLCRS